MDVAVVGDDEPVPSPSGRSSAGSVRGHAARAPRRGGRSDAGGQRAAAPRCGRVARGRRAHRAPAARRDAPVEAGNRWDTRRRRAGLTVLRREPTAREVDEIYVVIGPDTYLTLVEERGWSGEEYTVWLADALARLLNSTSRDDRGGHRVTTIEKQTHQGRPGRPGRHPDDAHRAHGAAPRPGPDAGRPGRAGRRARRRPPRGGRRAPAVDDDLAAPPPRGRGHRPLPVVRARNAAARALLDEMDADHQRILPAMAEVERAAAAYAASAGARDDAVTAVDDLLVCLLPHLQREEEEMMPVVSATITDREWRELDEKYNIDPLSKKELAASGLWIIDGLRGGGLRPRRAPGAGGPAVPDLQSARSTATGARRTVAGASASTPASGCPRPTGITSVVDRRAPLQVWRCSSDPTRTGEWSHECLGATVDRRCAPDPSSAHGSAAATGPGWLRWSRPCTITAATPAASWPTRPTAAGWVTAREWRFTLEPDGDGTRIAQSMRVMQAAGVGRPADHGCCRPHRDRAASCSVPTSCGWARWPPAPRRWRPARRADPARRPK